MRSGRLPPADPLQRSVILRGSRTHAVSPSGTLLCCGWFSNIRQTFHRLRLGRRAAGWLGGGFLPLLHLPDAKVGELQFQALAFAVGSSAYSSRCAPWPGRDVREDAL